MQISNPNQVSNGISGNQINLQPQQEYYLLQQQNTNQNHKKEKKKTKLKELNMTKTTLDQENSFKKTFKRQSTLIQKKEDPMTKIVGSSFAILFQSKKISELPKEKQFSVKYSQYRDYISTLNFSNNLFVVTPQEKNCPIYYAYIGKGNNHMLIRQIIKQRWWWVICNQVDQTINFMYTQTKNNNFMQLLKQNTNKIYLESQKQLNNQKIDLNSENKQKQSTDISESSSTFNIKFDDDNKKQSNSNNSTQITENQAQRSSTAQSDMNQSDKGLLSVEDNSESSDNEMQDSKSSSFYFMNKSKMQKKEQNKFQDTEKDTNSQIYDIDSPNISYVASKQQLYNCIQDKVPDEVNEKLDQKIVKLKEKDNKNISQGLKQLQNILNEDDFQILNQQFQSRKKLKISDYFLKNLEVVKKLKQGKNINVYQDPTQIKLHNHIEGNFHIGNKKLLFYNMRHYYNCLKKDVFEYLPLTFHIKDGKKDPEFQKFLQFYNNKNQMIIENEKKMQQNKGIKIKKIYNIWIVKPGENTNRGKGIEIYDNLNDIDQAISKEEFHKNGIRKTYIIQQYIDDPLLYQKRKFDIRCYYLITSYNNTIKGYWYQDGYLRTTSFEFQVKNLDKRCVHLTNDAVQKKSQDYGRFERGNKVSYDEFEQYTQNNHPGKSFYKDIYPKMKSIAAETIQAAYLKLQAEKGDNGYELLGLDFMVDENFKVWLIEINTNPDLNICSSVLAKIIPNLCDNMFKIALDPIFPPPTITKANKFQGENILENNKFELIFDEVSEEEKIKNTIQGLDQNIINVGLIEEEEEEFEQSDDEINE